MNNKEQKAELHPSALPIGNTMLGDVDVYSDFDHWKFSSALRHKRNVELRIDIRQAAMQIGISAPTLSRIENCKTPDLYTYFYCCRWLGVEMQSFSISPNVFALGVRAGFQGTKLSAQH